MDEKTLNLIHAENQHQAEEENPVPLAKPDDSYLLGNIF